MKNNRLTEMQIPSKEILEAFHLHGIPERLHGGQGQTFAIGDAVIKPVDDQAEARLLQILCNLLLKKVSG